VSSLLDPNPRGRPTKYQTDYPLIVFYARAIGQTDRQIAEALGVSETVFYEWLRKKPEFKQKYDEGTNALFDLSSQALFHKLRKRELKRTEYKEYLDRNGNVQKLKTETVQEADIDPLVLNNFLNRRVKAFKNDILEDANSDKVDHLLRALAELKPEAMQIALDDRAQRLAKKVVDGQTIEVKQIVEESKPKETKDLPP
jgi:transposase